MKPVKKIGILFGQEDTFPWAFLERVNSKKIEGIAAEPVPHRQARPGRAQRLRRHHRPHLPGRPVLPRLPEERRLERHGRHQQPVLVERGREVLQQLPGPEGRRGRSQDRAAALEPASAGHRPKSFRNLAYPAGLGRHLLATSASRPTSSRSPAAAGRTSTGSSSPDEFFRVYNETGQLVMMLQEEIVFTEYFRCYCLDCQDVRIMQYDPRQPFHLRYVRGRPAGPARSCSSRCTGRRAQAQPGPGLRLQHRRVRGARRHPVRHRLLQPGAGRRRPLDRRGQLRVGRRGRGQHGDPPRPRATSRARTTCAGAKFVAATAADSRQSRETGGDETSMSRSCSRWASRKSSSSSTRRRATCAPTSSSSSRRGRDILKDQLKPELHQSVIEVGTASARTSRRRGARSSRLRSKLARSRGATA